MICSTFQEDPHSHSKHEHITDEKLYQIMYYNAYDETCANKLSLDELAFLMATDSIMADTFCFIGSDSNVLQDDEFCDILIKKIDSVKAGQ